MMRRASLSGMIKGQALDMIFPATVHLPGKLESAKQHIIPLAILDWDSSGIKENHGYLPYLYLEKVQPMYLKSQLGLVEFGEIKSQVRGGMVLFGRLSVLMDMEVFLIYANVDTAHHLLILHGASEKHI